MKLRCLNPSCAKTFLYAAKLVTVRNTTTTIEQDYLGTSASSIKIPETTTQEFHVCPYCNNVNIDEFVEPQQEITSVKSVNLEDVDEWLGKGYVVRELYAKTATLIKKGEKSSLRERNESNDKDAAELRKDLMGFTEGLEGKI